MPVPQSTENAVSLPREIADFLVELSVALHKYGMYPDGHPLLENAVTVVARRVSALLVGKPELAIAVARNQLLVEGAATDPANGPMRDLAARLYRREIGTIRFSPGLTEAELTAALKLIARDNRDGTQAEREWEHAKLLPLTYDQLALSHGDGEGGEEQGSWASQLWSKLAKSALGMQRGDTLDLPAIPEDPLALAALIEKRALDPDFDKGIYSFFAQFLEAARNKSGSAAKEVRQRFASLIRGLTPGTLQRVLKIAPSSEQRRQLMLNASHALAADTVIDLAQAAAASSGHTMSEALLLLLSKLAKHAEEGTGPRRLKADAALRANVRQLISDWDGAAALPEDGYWKTLEKLIAEPAKEGAAQTVHGVAPDHIVQVALETETFGATAKYAVAEMIRQGKIAPLLSMADGTPGNNKVVWTLRRHLDNTGTIKRLLRDRPIDFEVLHRLVTRVGHPSAGALLDALGLEDDRNARWKLFEMLAALGPEVGDAVVARLPKAEWFMQRNLLLLLGRLQRWPDGFTPQPYARHPDARVRREAYALLLRDPKMRESAIAGAVRDTDERIIRAGLSGAMENGCPKEALPIITRRIAEGTLQGMLAALAVRVVAPLPRPEVVQSLITASLSKRKRLFFRRKLAAKSPGMLAALAGLSQYWKGDPAAAKVLAIAGKESDYEVQAALRGKIVGGSTGERVTGE